MISGLINLIVRTIILNPLVIAGIIAGWYIMTTYNVQVALDYAKNPYVYGVALAIGFVYAILFKHVYYDTAKKINWWATVKSSFGHMLTLLLACAFTCAIIYSYDYISYETVDNYLRDK